MFLILLLVVAVALLILATNRLKLHPFLALLFVAIGYGLLAGMPLSALAASLNEGFGSTVGHIGILIVAGTIIGTFLELSGGAFALAERVIRVIGERRVPLAMALIGAGSMVASHVNDSFFWVVTQMSNMDVPTGYKLHTAGSTVIGTATGVLIWALSLFAF